MNALYVARSLLDYRIPVLESLNELLDGGLSVLYSADYVPPRVAERLKASLGKNACGLSGEKRIGPNARDYHGFANRSVRLVYQPGLLTEMSRRTPDVLIGDGFFQWTAFAVVERIRKGTPLVVCYERTGHTDRNAQWYRRAYRKAVLPFVDAMACNGELSLDYARSLGMSANRITTGQMVADTSGLERAVAGLEGDWRRVFRERWKSPDLVFLAVGKMNVPKGIWELLFAWRQLVIDDGTRLALVLVGDGPEREAVKQYISEHDLRNVFVEGAVDYDDMAKYYAASDVFVMPSLEDNWSLVVPEAMACGLPVMVSRYNGCYPELARVGVNGWVFDPYSMSDFTKTLGQAVESRDALGAMGQRSRSIVQSQSPSHAAAAIHEACVIATRHRAGVPG